MLYEVITRQRGQPAVGLVLPADPAVLVVPAGHRLQLLGDLAVGVGPFFRGHRSLLAVR